jgi:hypothetical protein
VFKETELFGGEEGKQEMSASFLCQADALFFFFLLFPIILPRSVANFFFSFFSLSSAIRLFQVAAADNYLRFFSHIYVYIFPGIPDDSFEIGMLVHIAALLLLYAELI